MQPDPPLQPETLVESLRSGVFLCELALCISDDAARAIPKIHRNAQPGSLFAIENIQSFLHAAVQLGVNPRELFDPACLVSNVPEHRRDERELVYALLSFSLAAHVRYGFPAPDLKGTDPVADSTLAACLRTAIVASGSVNAQRLLTSSPDAKGAGAALLTDIVQAVGLDSTLDPQQKIVLGLDPETTTELAFSEASPSQRAPSRSKRGVPGAVASPAMSEGSVDDRDSTRLSTTSIASAASAPPELQTPPHVIVSRIAAADAVEQAIQAEYGGSEKIEESKDDKSGLKELDTAAVGPGEDEVTEADPGNPVRPLSKQRFSMLELSAEQEFFYLTALAVKMTHNWQEDACLISTSQIWEKVRCLLMGMLHTSMEVWPASHICICLTTDSARIIDSGTQSRLWNKRFPSTSSIHSSSTSWQSHYLSLKPG